ncbi:hypothetical protein [Clostridium tertium]|uniref:hypothetical protein n=1 Tax=Clostridium tertium TaxID=1559 RepID=UPI0023B2576A|nr:hypothetical protein [Clostridium tertium]
MTNMGSYKNDELDAFGPLGGRGGRSANSNPGGILGDLDLDEMASKAGADIFQRQSNITGGVNGFDNTTSRKSSAVRNQRTRNEVPFPNNVVGGLDSKPDNNFGAQRRNRENPFRLPDDLGNNIEQKRYRQPGVPDLDGASHLGTERLNTHEAAINSERIGMGYQTNIPTNRTSPVQQMNTPYTSNNSSNIERYSITDRIRDTMTTKDWIALILILIFIVMIVTPQNFR